MNTEIVSEQYTLVVFLADQDFNNPSEYKLFTRTVDTQDTVWLLADVFRLNDDLLAYQIVKHIVFKDGSSMTVDVGSWSSGEPDEA